MSYTDNRLDANKHQVQKRFEMSPLESLGDISQLLPEVNHTPTKFPAKFLSSLSTKKPLLAIRKDPVLLFEAFLPTVQGSTHQMDFSRQITFAVRGLQPLFL
jgi:hypothetical protein